MLKTKKKRQGKVEATVILKGAEKKIFDKRLKEINLVASILIFQLRSVDFNDFESILQWVEEFQPYSTTIGVLFDSKEITKKFEKQGFIAAQNNHLSFDENNKENFAEFIIGQTMYDLDSKGFIRPMVSTLIKNWKSNFIK